MIRKDFHHIFIAAVLALTGLALGRTPAQAAPGSTSIDTIVSIAYQAAPGGDTQIVSSNDAGVTVTVPAAGVALTAASDSQSITRPGRTVFPVTLRNTGSGTDTYTLTLTPAAGWRTLLIYDNYGDGVLRPHENTPVPAQVTLAAGELQPCFLLVIPANLHQLNTSGTVVLKAVSGTDATKFAQVSALTTIGAG